MGGPLEGIKVLELSRTLAGPYCSMLLADMGADVIKVEQPQIGDETRGYTPPDMNGESTYYLSFNRNKRGITLNLKSHEGQEIVRQLVKQSDVLVENFRTGTMEKFGLGYEDLKKINDQLVYCAVSGFGRTGPMKDEAAYDLLIQGYAGLMSVTGEYDGPPVKVGYSIADLTTGMYAQSAVVSALYNRERTGTGQYVEVSLLETIVSLQTYLALSYFATGNVPYRFGSAHPTIAPYQLFKASDGEFIIAVPNDWLWKKLCDALELDNLRDDPKFATNNDRVINREALVNGINEYTQQYPAKETMSKLKAAGVPCGPINNIDEVLSDPQVLHREMVLETDHPTIGKLKMLGFPMNFSDTPCSIRTAPPLLGQHTSNVLEELGYSTQDIGNLKEKKVI